jgi:hypothetical protein
MLARILYALGIFVVFGTVAVVLGRSAAGDWRRERRERDHFSLIFTVEQWWAAALAALVAIAAPVLVLVRD